MVTNDDDETFIIINNSPIERGHVLLVPKINQNLNQVLSEVFIFEYEFSII